MCVPCLTHSEPLAHVAITACDRIAGRVAKTGKGTLLGVRTMDFVIFLAGTQEGGPARGWSWVTLPNHLGVGTHPLSFLWLSLYLPRTGRLSTGSGCRPDWSLEGISV